MGKQSALEDPEVRAKLVAAVEDGHYVTDACALAKVSRHTLYKWLVRGEAEPGTVYAELADQIQQANAAAKEQLLACVRGAAGKGNWLAAAWILERRWPKDWGRRAAELDTLPEGVTPAKAAEMYRAAADRLEKRALDEGTAPAPPQLPEHEDGS